MTILESLRQREPTVRIAGPIEHSSDGIAVDGAIDVGEKLARAFIAGLSGRFETDFSSEGPLFNEQQDQNVGAAKEAVGGVHNLVTRGGVDETLRLQTGR